MSSTVAKMFGLVSADLIADALWEYGEETDDERISDPEQD